MPVPVNSSDLLDHLPVTVTVRPLLKRTHRTRHPFLAMYHLVAAPDFPAPVRIGFGMAVLPGVALPSRGPRLPHLDRTRHFQKRIHCQGGDRLPLVEPPTLQAPSVGGLDRYSTVQALAAPSSFGSTFSAPLGAVTDRNPTILADPILEAH
jgi:hypothetical protein